MQTRPVTKRHKSQPFVVVGCIIKKGDKFLLVQEATHDRGLWNQPAGWLDWGEKIIDGAKREAYEETGLRIKIIGLLGVFTLIKHGTRHAVKFIFAATASDDTIKFDHKELQDARWFTYAEAKKLGRKLRDKDILKEIEQYRAGRLHSADSVNFYTQQS